MKFETFIKEEYREPDNKTKTFFKKYRLGEPSNITKSYYVRVYHKGYLVDEVSFCNAVDAQNYIQKQNYFIQICYNYIDFFNYFLISKFRN